MDVCIYAILKKKKKKLFFQRSGKRTENWFVAFTVIGETIVPFAHKLVDNAIRV